jgi:hypothetical protein
VLNPADGDDHPAVAIDLVVDPHGLLAPEDFVVSFVPDNYPVEMPLTWTVQGDGTWSFRLSGGGALPLAPGFVGGAEFNLAVGPAAKHGTIDVDLVVTDVDPNTLEPIAEVIRDDHAVELHLAVEPSEVVPATPVDEGDSITISVEGFAPNAEVTFTLHSEPIVLGTATADADGAATATFTLPSGVVGAHTIEATGLGLDGTAFSVVQDVTISIPPPPTSTASASAPASPPPAAWLLVAAVSGVLAGGWLLRAMRSRRS